MANGGAGNGRVAAILAAVLLFGGMAAIAHAGVLDRFFGTSPKGAARAAGVVETADQVTIPLAALDSGKALFLQLESEGRTLYYLALRSRDGKYRSALDACDVCFRANRGYRQEGDQLICNNCGQAFAADRLGDAKGGCNPHPLPHRIEGGVMAISKADIVAGKKYFERKRQ